MTFPTEIARPYAIKESSSSSRMSAFSSVSSWFIVSGRPHSNHSPMLRSPQIGPTWDLQGVVSLSAAGGTIPTLLPTSKGSFGIMGGTSFASPYAAVSLAFFGGCFSKRADPIPAFGLEGMRRSLLRSSCQSWIGSIGSHEASICSYRATHLPHGHSSCSSCSSGRRSNRCVGCRSGQDLPVSFWILYRKREVALTVAFCSSPSYINLGDVGTQTKTITGAPSFSYRSPSLLRADTFHLLLDCYPPSMFTVFHSREHWKQDRQVHRHPPTGHRPRALPVCLAKPQHSASRLRHERTRHLHHASLVHRRAG